MKNSNDLFRLIHALNANEKRYFRLYAGLQQGSKNYLQLFEVLEQETTCNEAQLLEQHSGKAFTRHFAFTKNYLYRQILRAVTHSQTDNFTEQTLWNELQQAHFLHRKQLYRQCEKLIAKIKKKAYQYEVFSVLPDVLLLQGQLLSKFAVGQFREDFLQVISEREHCMQLHQNYLLFKNLYDRMFYLLTISGSLPNPETAGNMTDLANHPLLQNPQQALSNKAKIVYYNILFLHAYYLANYEKSLNYKQQALQILENMPSCFTEDLEMYVNNISNVMVLLNLLRRYAETLLYINKLKNLKPANTALQALVFQTCYSTSLVVYAALADVETPLSMVNDIETGLNKYKNSINKIRRIDLCFNVAILYFKTAQYKKAHIWLEKVMSEDGNIREDIHCFSRIFNLLIHFELGNHLLLESLVRNNTRYLKQQKKAFRFEKIMLRFFYCAAMAANRAALQPLYKDLLQKLHALAQHHNEKRPLAYFDFISWAECKLQKRPLLEVLKTKAGRQQA